VNSSGGGTKQRIVEHLQTVATATAPDLARLMGVSDAAMRQHLEQLESDGVVRRESENPSGDTRSRGRPATRWSLDRQRSRTVVDGFPGAFPDRHVDLAVDLLSAVRESLGEESLRRVLAHRGEQQVAEYRRVVGEGSLSARVERLARVRDIGGYRAEASADDDGSVVLTEHHCPIADAARVCGDVCESELVVFRATLGPGVDVQRTQHAMSGDSRCSYRISVA